MARDVVLHVRLSKQEMKKVEKQAALRHLPTSTWVRQVVLTYLDTLNEKRAD